MAVSMRRGKSGREAEKEKGGGTAPTFIGLAALGEGPPQIETSSPESGAPIVPDPLTWPDNFSQKPPHFVSGKAVSNSGNIPL